MAVMAVDAGAPVPVNDRLEAIAGEVLPVAMNRRVPGVNGALCLPRHTERRTPSRSSNSCATQDSRCDD
jgi:hypothetical protein